MATQMSNFGGTIPATTINAENSEIIATNGKAQYTWKINSERVSNSTIIIFSIVLNNKYHENVSVDICLLPGNQPIDNIVYVAKDVIVVPGRPVSLDYKVNMGANDALHVCASQENAVDIIISAVQL